MSTNLIATIQSTKNHQLAKIINQACFPFSLATNLLTNHNGIEKQSKLNYKHHHFKLNQRENQIQQILKPKINNQIKHSRIKGKIKQK